MRDLWAHADIGSFATGYHATVAPHETVLLRVEGKPPPLPHGTAFISDLGWTYAANFWGPPERDQSNGERVKNDGKPISIAGVKYDKGVGVHAGSLIRVRLGGACSTFSANVGVDDEVNAGTVDFKVWADGELVADSGVIRSGVAAKELVADVSGRGELLLSVDPTEDGSALDHADWAAARVTCDAK